jgi:hypothetical protein
LQHTQRSPKTYGLVLCAGFALAAVGLAIGPRAPAPQGDPPPPPVTGEPLPTFPVTGMSDSNGSMIAVTGIDMTGTSILYLVDTQSRQLAVYQANGGTDSMQGLKLVGARRIDLDLQLYGYNDKSEYSYEDLKKKFTDSTTTVPPVK